MEYKNLEDFIARAGHMNDGIWYPRVTSIISIKSKPALYRYYASMPSWFHAERIKNKSAEEGTLIHEAVQSAMVGEEYDNHTENTLAAVLAYKQFNDQLNLISEKNKIEYKIVNQQEKYAGTIDAIVTIGDKTGVLDIKTSPSVYRDYNLQTAAYMESARKDFPEVSTRWILLINTNQTCELCGSNRRIKGGKETLSLNTKNDYSINCLHKWSALKGNVLLKELKDFEMDYEAFLGAKKLWEWEYAGYLKKIGYKQ